MECLISQIDAVINSPYDSVSESVANDWESFKVLIQNDIANTRNNEDNHWR